MRNRLVAGMCDIVVESAPSLTMITARLRRAGAADYYALINPVVVVATN